MNVKQKLGFTIVELLVVIVVIGILASIVLVSYSGSQEQTYYNRAKTELTTMTNAIKLYSLKYNTYPPDVSRGLPSGIEEFVTKDPNVLWPLGPWPGSVYDYENWVINGVTTIQISIRFCPQGAPDTSQCHFPRQPWASNFGVDSAVYYCITGNCRSHQSQPVTYPGYCLNCPGNRPIGT